MPRIVGQIDVSKNEAILDAAIEVLGERGLTASMDEIARRAGVSKQTIYNHYGSKIEVVRALTERRVAAITAPLLTPGAEDDPEATLAAYGRALLEIAASPRSVDLLRLAVAHAAEVPDVARTMYEHGARASRLKLGAFLARASGRSDLRAGSGDGGGGLRRNGDRHAADSGAAGRGR